MKKIMFICSGNTCRSPLAEGLFKKYLQENNITDIEVESAGVGAFPGDAVSINSILVAGSRGVDISDHRARNINPEHLLTTDLFFCMSESHKSVLSRHCDEEKIIVLNVPDAYGRPIEAYEECAKQLESQFSKILETIQNTTYIQEMTESDIKEIAQLEKECFSEPWSEDSLKDELTNETARFYVLRDNEKLLGYIGSNNICNEVYITNVAV
ncbi:MAG: hypothetical protein IKW34_00890, partial [Clostridia bacterium]|nr:hypothetical protein [Clostridia bacterium]